MAVASIDLEPDCLAINSPPSLELKIYASTGVDPNLLSVLIVHIENPQENQSIVCRDPRQARLISCMCVSVVLSTFDLLS